MEIEERPVIAWCYDKEGLITMPVVPGPLLQRDCAPFADIMAIEINGKLWRLFDNFDCVWPLKNRRALVEAAKALRIKREAKQKAGEARDRAAS